VLLESSWRLSIPDPSQLERYGKEVAALNDARVFGELRLGAKFATSTGTSINAVGDGLDAVIIETPNHQHILPALMAIRRGIHVFLDKPLVLTVAEGDLLLAETRKRHGIVTQVGTYGHTFPSMTYCVDRIREGALGEVTEVWAYDDRCNSVYTRPGAVPPPKGMDWDAWCGGSPICDFIRKAAIRTACIHTVGTVGSATGTAPSVISACTSWMSRFMRSVSRTPTG
jgi:predicted dehydrogenase